jgi:hypothetical protein
VLSWVYSQGSRGHTKHSNIQTFPVIRTRIEVVASRQTPDEPNGNRIISSGWAITMAKTAGAKVCSITFPTAYTAQVVVTFSATVGVPRFPIGRLIQDRFRGYRQVLDVTTLDTCGEVSADHRTFLLADTDRTRGTIRFRAKSEAAIPSGSFPNGGWFQETHPGPGGQSSAA